MEGIEELAEREIEEAWCIGAPIENAPVHQEHQPYRRPVVVDAAGLLLAEFAPRERLLEPWLTTQSLAMIYAARGTGKTHVALGVAYALASGGEFLVLG